MSDSVFCNFSLIKTSGYFQTFDNFFKYSFRDKITPMNTNSCLYISFLIAYFVSKIMHTQIRLTGQRTSDPKKQGFFNFSSEELFIRSKKFVNKACIQLFLKINHQHIRISHIPMTNKIFNVKVAHVRPQIFAALGNSFYLSLRRLNRCLRYSIWPKMIICTP